VFVVVGSVSPLVTELAQLSMFYFCPFCPLFRESYQVVQSSPGFHLVFGQDVYLGGCNFTTVAKLARSLFQVTLFGHRDGFFTFVLIKTLSPTAKPFTAFAGGCLRVNIGAKEVTDWVSVFQLSSVLLC
jgi:hypothetical protein